MNDRHIPAFPTVMLGEIEGGMTLRDYFAAKALQGMMVDVQIPNYVYIAETAYEMADAMLKAREA